MNRNTLTTWTLAMLAAIMMGCNPPEERREIDTETPDHPYHRAVELIRAAQYNDAAAVLKTIPVGDSLAPQAGVALAVCTMGEFYRNKKYEEAQGVLMNTEGEDVENMQDGHYTLNISPKDPLFSHAAALAHLVMGENIIRYWTDYKKMVDGGEVEEMGTGTIRGALWLKAVFEGLPDAVYAEIDHVRADEDLFSVKYPPYLCSIGLKKLEAPGELSAEVAAMQVRLSKTIQLQNEIEHRIMSMHGDR